MEKRSRDNIYEYFKEYTKEEIDQAIKLLNERGRNLIKQRYGEDLENPQLSIIGDDKDRNYFNTVVFTKIKEKLKKVKNNSLEVKEESQLIEEIKNQEVIENEVNPLELLNHPFFKKMMEYLPIEDCVILTLSVGFKEKNFETEKIANFLGKSEEEVEEHIINGLNVLKEQTNTRFKQVKQRIKK